MGSQDCVTLFLCGDVMTGRAIDQILPHPCPPHLYESYLRSATEYVALAEGVSGPIPRPCDFAYVWGDALRELERRRPAARIVNLETAVTTSEQAWPGKGIHYRMHPANVPCLTVAGLDCCVLANNHTLDWGREGLHETLATLHDAGLRTAGAGLDLAQACMPAHIDLPTGARILVFACGATDSGVSPDWAATARRSGLCVLESFSVAVVERIAAQVRAHKRRGDIVVMSLHWGGNWGYEVPEAHRAFARRLIEAADVDVVHGHSSHHPKTIEVFRHKLILYGCGDFLNDYEGIGGYEAFRPDLGLMYFPTLDMATGALVQLTMVPTQMRALRVNRAGRADAHWLVTMLSRTARAFGCEVQVCPDETLALHGIEALP
ncbi:MAG: poly-gamma-glutamate biosynthesis protein [Proteobacteria bacterium]|nr:MAG: poly-gamma-glutamate biosynthesis protein [Pseudomonadota bacterium]